jgi:prophage antirepressor-like protein
MQLNEIQIFESPEFGQVRTVTINNEPYFVGKDAAEKLGYSNTRDALLNHVEEEDKADVVIYDGSQNRNMVAINESGLYSLIFGSKLPSAKRFKKWVTSEVLPSIRKTGTYQKPLNEREIMRIQLTMIDDVVERVDKLENNMTIDYGQQKVLERLVNSTVITVLGGKESNAYKEVSKKVFSECNRDIKDRFNVNSRSNVPKVKFEEACAYIKKWQPSGKTSKLIEDCNAQLCI